jgi:outer membrane murein-binding lipoprotein Lpp
MTDDLSSVIEDLAGEVRNLADRIDELERAVRSGSSGPAPAAGSSLSAQIDQLTREVRAIRREMF